jgi:hypothetical protein
MVRLVMESPRHLGESSSPDPGDISLSAIHPLGGSREVRWALIAATTGSPSWPDLAQFDQFQAECLNLREDAEHCRAVREQSGEYGLSGVDVMDHRGKGGERGRPKAALDADGVKVVLSAHAIIVRGVR